MSSQPGMQSSLIFIPDISGFTTFINEVEVSHSTHIIQELIEIIIESNILDLEVSEIEGDAVLFYKIGKKQPIQEILKQASVMLLEFYRHLKLYETRRICQCGACSSVKNLSLKFVSHYGEVSLTTIKGYRKLLGPDVTTAHRLLKNSIAEKEYILITTDEKETDELISELKSGFDNYEGIGVVRYNYISLTSLKSKLSEFSEQKSIDKYQNPVSASQIIESSLGHVHGIVTNVLLKPEWIIGLKSVKEEKNELSRIGSRHACIMPAMSMDLEVTSQKIAKGFIEYVEKTESLKWFSTLSIVYIMRHITDDKIKMTIAVHYKQNILSKLHLDLPLRMMILFHIKLSLRRLKKFIANQMVNSVS